MVNFRSPHGECVGEVRNIGLGGLMARLPRMLVSPGEILKVGPEASQEIEYEVLWTRPHGKGVDVGMKFPGAVFEFWHSWAADLLANAPLTNGQVFERRRQIRLDCSLSAVVKFDGNEVPIRVLDLGGGGALLEGDFSLHEGEGLTVTLKEPIRVGQLPCVVARKWDSPTPRYGVSFMELKKRHRLGLMRLLDVLSRLNS